MKSLIFFVLFIVAYCYSSAQIPQTISWQGIVQDGQGNNLNGEYSIVVRLFDNATEGTALWSETHTAAVENGLVNIELGSVTPFNISFDKAFWLEVQVGTANPMPRLRLSSVPYALYSEKSSGAIINDSLVLKDSRGVTRMVLNPNTGTFKMMNDDTVWYELNVNSPSLEMYDNGNGTTSIRDGGNVLVVQNITQNPVSMTGSYENADGTTTNFVTHYDPNVYEKELTSEDVTFRITPDGLEVEKNEFTYTDDEDRTILNKEITLNGEVIRKEKWIGAVKVEEWFKEGTNEIFREYNSTRGEITREMVNDGTNLTITTRDNGGSFSQQRIEYDFFNKSIVKNGNYGMETEMSEGALYWKKYNSTRNLMFQPTDDSYNTGYSLIYGQGFNPLSGFTFNYNGSVDYKGAASFENNVTMEQSLDVTGNLNVNGTKNFRIAHPDDPENKYLVHAAVESDEVLNQYTGNIITDEKGIAIVALPDYIQKINKNFRYQLTVIGDFAQAIISKEIQNNQFEIKTDKPNIKVSWMLIGERNDKYMQEHPFEPVIIKTSIDK